jgi:hypothetical protein
MAVWIGTGCLIALVLAVLLGLAHLSRLRRHVRDAWDHAEALLGCRRELAAALVRSAGQLPPGARAAVERIVMALPALEEAREVAPRAEAENRLAQALRELLAARDTREVPPFSFREEWLAVEREISHAREAYNGRVMIYNQSIHRLPWRLLAAGRRPLEYLILEEAPDDTTGAWASAIPAGAQGGGSS